ncbi:MAG: insulinase family protein [Saccharospirillum sp.]|uniref:M16 family metallopeptidase n=1 Tax=Saccharospirillum sp. TaxID=2033801 RepID=UPI003299DE60
MLPEYSHCGRFRALFITAVILTLAACANQTAYFQPSFSLEKNRPELYVWPNSNSHSKNEASISLLVKAGSLQEEASELGYAHFVEHMAFNGTEAFPGETIRTQLESLGMSLGDHSNAYTTFDHTSYDLHLNTVDPERLEAAIQLLSEWAYRIEFNDQEVQKEKAIIIEEWRLSETEADRVDARIQENYLAGSRLAERLPIGTKQSIESATADALETFYQRWYRANNMAIIVTGDVDEQLVSELVAQYFPEDTQQSPDPGVFSINPSAMQDRLILTDPYESGGYVSFDYYVPYSSPRSVNDVLAIQHWQAALDIWYDRVQARLPETEGAVVDADYYWETVSPEILNVSLSAYLPNGDFEQAIGVIERERQHIATSGVRQSELDNWRNGLLEHERSQQDSAGHLAGVIYDHILYGWPMLSQSERIALYEDRLDELTPQSVQAAFAALFHSDPKVTLVHPYQSPAPSTADVDTWLAGIEVTSAQASNNDVQSETLWTIAPASTGTIVREESLPEAVTRWTLGNGVTVYYRYSDQAPGKVYYELHGLQGFNALPPNETAVARLALPAMGTSGLREMNGAQLNEWLNARAITQVPTFSFFDRGMYGSGPSPQLPVMMRLLHIALTEAEVDEVAWRHIRNQYRDHLNQLKGNPHEPWFNLVETSLFNNDVALRLTAEELERIDTAAIQAVYNTYYAGTQNYRMSIVGDVSKSAVKSSLLEAIATLPRQSADWTTPRSYPSPQASGSHTVSNSGEQSAAVVLRYSLPKTEMPEASFTTLSLLEAWINNALFEDIRENKGHVYAISSIIDGATVTQSDYTLIIELATDPASVEAVVSEVKSRLQSLVESPATESQVRQWHETLERDFLQTINGAEQQAEALAYAPLFGKDPIAALRFDSAPPATPDQLVELATQFTHPDTTLIELVWMP